MTRTDQREYIARLAGILTSNAIDFDAARDLIDEMEEDANRCHDCGCFDCTCPSDAVIAHGGM